MEVGGSGTGTGQDCSAAAVAAMQWWREDWTSRGRRAAGRLWVDEDSRSAVPRRPGTRPSAPRLIPLVSARQSTVTDHPHCCAATKQVPLLLRSSSPLSRPPSLPLSAVPPGPVPMMTASDQLTAPAALNPFHGRDVPQPPSDSVPAYTRSPASSASSGNYSSLPTADKLEFQGQRNAALPQRTQRPQSVGQRRAAAVAHPPASLLIIFPQTSLTLARADRSAWMVSSSPSNAALGRSPPCTCLPVHC